MTNVFIVLSPPILHLAAWVQSSNLIYKRTFPTVSSLSLFFFVCLEVIVTLRYIRQGHKPGCVEASQQSGWDDLPSAPLSPHLSVNLDALPQSSASVVVISPGQKNKLIALHYQLVGGAASSSAMFLNKGEINTNFPRMATRTVADESLLICGNVLKPATELS